MKAESLMDIIGASFYAGVPDSQLKSLCSAVMDRYGMDPKHHIIAANEGNAAGLAAGYYLAAGEPAVVYMQNSGEGNVINPAASLLNEKVYGIPVIFVIGWRGEPGVHDEPQHIFQGEITLKLLEVMGIDYFVIGKETTEEEVSRAMEGFRRRAESGSSSAFVVKKGALSFDGKAEYKNDYTMTREEVIRRVTLASGDDPVVSTTGKASRELFEIREAGGPAAGPGGLHGRDFLTVGSMGHSSSIALALALQKPEKRVWCIDGDGAAIMHMGAMAVIGAKAPANFIHILINNESHETVGGMPTVSPTTDFPAVAKACGYRSVFTAENCEELEKALGEAKAAEGPVFLEAKCAIGAREDLGRPTTTAKENREAFMKSLIG